MYSLRALVISIGLIAPALALAEEGPGRACKNDIKTLCGSVQPGGGRIRDCLRDHRSEVSQACKLAIADRVLERRHTTGSGAAGSQKPPAKPNN